MRAVGYAAARGGAPTEGSRARSSRRCRPGRASIRLAEGLTRYSGIRYRPGDRAMKHGPPPLARHSSRNDDWSGRSNGASCCSSAGSAGPRSCHALPSPRSTRQPVHAGGTRRTAHCHYANCAGKPSSWCRSRRCSAPPTSTGPANPSPASLPARLGDRTGPLGARRTGGGTGRGYYGKSQTWCPCVSGTHMTECLYQDSGFGQSRQRRSRRRTGPPCDYGSPCRGPRLLPERSIGRTSAPVQGREVYS